METLSFPMGLFGHWMRLLYFRIVFSTQLHLNNIIVAVVGERQSQELTSSACVPFSRGSLLCFTRSVGSSQEAYEALGMRQLRSPHQPCASPSWLQSCLQLVPFPLVPGLFVSCIMGFGGWGGTLDFWVCLFFLIFWILLPDSFTHLFSLKYGTIWFPREKIPWAGFNLDHTFLLLGPRIAAATHTLY